MVKRYGRAAFKLPDAVGISESSGKWEEGALNDFEMAKLAGLTHLQRRQGIGTLGERSLHSILKYWADPDEAHHERSLGLGRLVADIFDGQRVTEIQTRSFQALRPKLDRLLAFYPVTVIYPIAHEKRLIWVNPESGESTTPRKSPKTGCVWDAFHELYSLRGYLTEPKLTVRLVLLDMEEYRMLDGWSRDKKKGAHRMERIPSALCEVVDLRSPVDYAALLPLDLPLAFTTGDLSKKLHVSMKRAGEIANIMYLLNVVIRIGKRGRSFLYTLASKAGAADGILLEANMSGC